MHKSTNNDHKNRIIEDVYPQEKLSVMSSWENSTKLQQLPPIGKARH